MTAPNSALGRDRLSATRQPERTAFVMKFLLIAMAFVAVAPVLSATSEPWYPEVKFKLETSSYMDTLHWISGFSYALTETSRDSKKTGIRGAFCAPTNGYIGSKELLEILNEKYAGKTISSEVASSTLLQGVKLRFPCK